MTSSAELRSEHPLGKAVVIYYRTTSDEILKEPQEFFMYSGRGIKAVVDSNVILAGSIDLLAESSIAASQNMLDKSSAYRNEGCTIIYVAINNCEAGFIALSDTLRSDSAEMIKKLQTLNLKCILLTGDNLQAASHIAKCVGITSVHSECLPETKMSTIEQYQNKNEMICMVGDGINDAPALKKAFVGVAMGGIGSDIAVDAADIALISDDIKHIPHLVRLSKKTMSTIKLNLALSMILNFAAIILAMAGVLNPIFGALVHNVGSVAVIINSALLLNFKSSKG